MTKSRKPKVVKYTPLEFLQKEIEDLEYRNAILQETLKSLEYLILGGADMEAIRLAVIIRKRINPEYMEGLIDEVLEVMERNQLSEGSKENLSVQTKTDS